MVKCGLRTGTFHHGVPLVNMGRLLWMRTGVMSMRPRTATWAAPRCSLMLPCSGVRVPSGKMMRLLPARSDFTQSSSKPAPSPLVIKPAARMGPRMKGLWASAALTMQSAWRTNEIKNTTSISEG
ncbi:hypothetical protein D3C72_2073370 [compost metagenome]